MMNRPKGSKLMAQFLLTILGNTLYIIFVIPNFKSNIGNGYNYNHCLRPLTKVNFVGGFVIYCRKKAVVMV